MEVSTLEAQDFRGALYLPKFSAYPRDVVSRFRGRFGETGSPDQSAGRLSEGSG